MTHHHPTADAQAMPGTTAIQARDKPASEANAWDVDVSVVIVSFNTARLLRPMFNALHAAQAGLRLQVIVVDNASTDDSVQVLRRDFPQAKLIVNQGNVGFGRANNQALPHLRGRHVLLLNTDAFMAPTALRTAVDHLEAHQQLGLVGARLVGRNGEPQPSARWFPTLLSAFVRRTGLDRLLPRGLWPRDLCPTPGQVVQCDWVPGCFYLLRREVVEQLGLFDPRFFLYYEEVEHCRRVRRAGWQVACLGAAEVVHIGGESAKSVASVTAAGQQISPLQIESEILYYRKEYGLLGALACVGISTLADALLALKGIVRGRSAPAWLVHWTHCKTMWALSARTGLGARPTR